MSSIALIQQSRGSSESAVYHSTLKTGMFFTVESDITNEHELIIKDLTSNTMPARLTPKLLSFATGGHLVVGTKFRVHNFRTQKFNDVLHLMLEKIEIEHLKLTSLTKIVSSVDELTGECTISPPYKLQLIVSGDVTSVSDGKHAVPAIITGLSKIEKKKMKSNDTLVIDQTIILQTDDLSKLVIQTPRIENPVPWTVNNPTFQTIEKLQQYALERKRKRESQAAHSSPLGSTSRMSNISSLTSSTLLASPPFSLPLPQSSISSLTSPALLASPPFSLPLPPPHPLEHDKLLLHKALYILTEVNHSHPGLLQMFNLKHLPPSPRAMDPLMAMRERLRVYELPTKDTASPFQESL